jgi:hypothetical protein
MNITNEQKKEILDAKDFKEFCKARSCVHHESRIPCCFGCDRGISGVYFSGNSTRNFCIPNFEKIRQEALEAKEVPERAPTTYCADCVAENCSACSRNYPDRFLTKKKKVKKYQWLFKNPNGKRYVAVGKYSEEQMKTNDLAVRPILETEEEVEE